MGKYDDYKWIKVPRFKFDPNLSWEENYRRLEEHHVTETSFLIAEVRKLDGQITESTNVAGNPA